MREVAGECDCKGVQSMGQGPPGGGGGKGGGFNKDVKALIYTTFHDKTMLAWTLSRWCTRHNLIIDLNQKLLLEDGQARLVQFSRECPIAWS